MHLLAVTIILEFFNCKQLSTFKWLVINLHLFSENKCLELQIQHALDQTRFYNAGGAITTGLDNHANASANDNSSYIVFRRINEGGIAIGNFVLDSL